MEIKQGADLGKVWDSVQVIYTEISEQQLADDPVDEAIKYLASYTNVFSKRTGSWRTFDKYQIALILGRFCVQNDIAWDYSGFTPQEVEYFNKSLLGRGLIQASEEATEDAEIEAGEPAEADDANKTAQPQAQPQATAAPQQPAAQQPQPAAQPAASQPAPQAQPQAQSQPAAPAQPAQPTATSAPAANNTAAAQPAQPAKPAPRARDANGKVIPKTRKATRVKPDDDDPNSKFRSMPTAGNYVKDTAVHGREWQKKITDPNDPNYIPPNDYKKSGPRSRDAFDLKDTPLNPKELTGEEGYLFVVTASDTSTSANRPFAFINPLINTTKYRNANTNIVNFGSAHGYSDLILFFNTEADADDFMHKMLNANKFPKKIADAKGIVQVGKQKISRNQRFFASKFYLIGTDLGDAYVCAYKLNEDLEENLDEELITEPIEPAEDKIDYKEAVRQMSRNVNWD
jgi:hypothetical protein